MIPYNFPDAHSAYVLTWLGGIPPTLYITVEEVARLVDNQGFCPEIR